MGEAVPGPLENNMAEEKAVHLSAQEFDKAIADNKVALVDFWAAWCGPCRMVGPMIEKLAGEYDGKALVGKVNVDEENELAARYQVMSIPTVILFRNGKEIGREVGVMPRERYTSMLDENL